MANDRHAFQPLLHPLDEYALHIVEKYLRPRVPTGRGDQHTYFNPYLDDKSQRQKVLLERNQRYLRDNLVYGRSIQRLGTLLFCLDYAHQGGWGAPSVWRDVEEVFSGPAMERLFPHLQSVNAFHNTRVAHVETPLDQADEA